MRQGKKEGEKRVDPLSNCNLVSHLNCNHKSEHTRLQERESKEPTSVANIIRRYEKCLGSRKKNHAHFSFKTFFFILMIAHQMATRREK